MMPGQVIDLLIVYSGVFGRHPKGLCGNLLRITLFVLYGERGIVGILQTKSNLCKILRIAF